jgi:hypothetical protein
MSPEPRLRGRCRALYCFDVARTIDLVRAEATLRTTRRTTFHHKGRFPALRGVAAPVRVSWHTPAIEIGGERSDTEVEIALYDFGAVAITWSHPVEGGLDDLVRVTGELYDNTTLIARSREIALELVQQIGEAADRARLHDVVEDYVVFELEPVEGGVERLLFESRGDLARVLRAEEQELSEQEVEDALDSAVSYGRDDVSLVDWLGALLIGRDTQDERLLLELATVELLELRVLDAQLDEEMESAYRLLTTRRSALSGFTTMRREIERIARTQADDALLHEGIDNALKLFGDDYLARLYHVSAERFHFDDYDAAIQRKLGVVHSIFESLAGQAAHRRAEVLEWIIILLFAIDIVLILWPST